MTGNSGRMNTGGAALRTGVVAVAIAGTAFGVHAASGSSAPPAPPAASAAAQVPPRPAPVHTPALNTSAVVVSAHPAGVQVFDGPGGAPKLHLGGRTDLGAVQTLLT